jgi:hypothetical protein
MMGWSNSQWGPESSDPPYKSVVIESDGAVAPPAIIDESQNARKAFVDLNCEHIVKDYTSEDRLAATDAEKAVIAKLVERAFNEGVKSERLGTCIPEAIEKDIAVVVDACAQECEFNAPEQVEYIRFQARNAFWRGMTTERKAQLKWGAFLEFNPSTQPASRHQFFS